MFLKKIGKLCENFVFDNFSALLMVGKTVMFDLLHAVSEIYKFH